MAVVQPVPDDEIDAELAAGWGAAGDDLPARLAAVVAGQAAEAGARRPGPIERRRPGDPADLVEAAQRVRPVSLAGDQLLPLSPAFADVLPQGLRRGTTVAVTGTTAAGDPAMVGEGATTLTLALVAAASANGGWIAVVGMPGLGLAATAEAGVALERFVVVPDPPPEQWTTVVAALVGSFDVVLVTPPARLRPSEVRRVAARARERGSLLVQLGGAPPAPADRAAPAPSDRAAPAPADRAAPAPRPGLEADVRLTVRTVAWSGLGAGHGRLDARRVVVEAGGRRGAARPRRAELWLPDADGVVRVVTPDELAALGSFDGHHHDGSAASDLEQARRARIRRIARQPVDVVPAAVTTTPAAAATGTAVASRPRTAWSDAG